MKKFSSIFQALQRVNTDTKLITLVALAALAATGAFAQSSVQIVGTFDPSVARSNTSYADGTAVSNTFIRNNSQGTSQITFKGTEDLGGGLKASFLFENDFDTRYDANGQNGVTASAARGVNFGSNGGEQFLALEGNFGKVQLGAANTPTLNIQASRQPFSTKIGSGFKGDGVGVLGQGHVRNNNSVVYTTPTMNGFTVSAGTGFAHNAVAAPSNGATPAQAVTNLGAGNTDSTVLKNQGAYTDISLNYANGPLAAGVSFWSAAAQDNLATGGYPSTISYTTPSVKQTNLYASYDFGVAKVMGGYHTEKQDAFTGIASTTANVNAAGTALTGAQASGTFTQKGANYTGWNLATSVPLSGDLSLLANYGKLQDKLSQRAANPLDKSIFAIGLRYNLSKNTSLYARYIEEKNENIAAAIAANGAGTAASPLILGGVTGNNAVKVQTTLFGMQTNF